MHDFASGFSPISPLLYFQGNMNLSSRIKAFSAVRAHQQGNFAALGGRSMGARAAVMAMLENTPDGADGDRGDGGGEGGMKLVLVSYPLTAGKDGEKREFDRREKILLDLPASVEVLFVVGSQDAQCDLELLEDVRGRMEAQSWLVVVEGADHGMECRPKGSTAELRAVSGRVAAEWIMARDGGRRYCEVRGDGEGDVVCAGWKEGRSVGAEVDVEDE
jgi:predicted alpha/beta-hydrolase family hydrolase